MHGVMTLREGEDKQDFIGLKGLIGDQFNEFHMAYYSKLWNGFQNYLNNLHCFLLFW